MWKPLHSRADRNDLPKPDLELITAVASHSWADGTLGTYGSGLLLFHAYCDSRSIPELARAPASADLIAGFLATAAGSYSGKTLENYLAAVRAWHILHGVPWGPNKDECDALLRAATTLQPKSAHRKKRQPYLVETLTVILSHLDLANCFDAAVASCLTAAFYSCSRLGELTVKSLTLFDPRLHVKHSNVREERNTRGLQMTVFFIPVTKANPDGEDVYFGAHPGASDPFTLFRNHLQINDPPLDSHLFAYRHPNGLRPLTKPAFIARIHKACRAAGIDPLQGHGIRIGSTLFYLLRGTPFDVVKTIGRWKSDAFLLYL
ncbi:hypothetical protein R3P38DRAFT_2580412 [Favolaschia claudopus]|uniref:Tyr recombinase domain-containing protein n=1 Tax=Favolaschia claudopus TaxID=2862362 RepID=A0AAV9ZDV4_9AGAR